MQRMWVFLLVPALMIVSCNQTPSATPKAPAEKGAKPAGTPAEGAPAASSDAASSKEAAILKTPEINAGDVEYAVSIEAAVAPESEGPNVTVEKIGGANSTRVGMITVTLTPPLPQQFWVNYQVKTQQPFPNTPVALRAKVVADLGESKKELASFSCVIGKEKPKTVLEKKVDILAGIENPPAKFLVRTKCEALLMPLGTDEATLNPDMAATTPERQTSVIKECPIQVNIKSAGEQQ